jgi:hypothetical protein
MEKEPVSCVRKSRYQPSSLSLDPSDKVVREGLEIPRESVDAGGADGGSPVVEAHMVIVADIADAINGGGGEK